MTSHKLTRRVALLPFLSWMRELRDGAVLRADVLAGVTVALVLIPQSMAYAQLAGLKPYHGLYAAFLPPMIAALFGSSRQLATGPVAVVSLLTAAVLAPLVGAGYDVAVCAALLALLAGIFQLALGLLRLGLLVNFLSHPVVIGFTNAAALIIATSQLDKLFGVRADPAEHQLVAVWNVLVAAWRGVYWPALGVGALALGIMLVQRRWLPRWPGVLIAVVLTTVLAWSIEYHRSFTVSASALGSPAVAAIVRDDGESRREIAAFDREVAEALAHLQSAELNAGFGDARVAEARHSLDLLRQKRERRQKTVATNLKELRGMRFRRVPGAEGAAGSFYAPDELIQGVETDKREWRLRRIDDDGAVVMVSGGNVVGMVPEGLPSFRLPWASFDLLLQLLPGAIALSLVGFIEAIAIAKAMAVRLRHRLDPNQELFGQGLANLAGAVFQGYPVSGSFSRSAVNLNAGARTGFASVVTTVIVVVALLFCTPLLYHLPEATLAAVIMMAVIGLVNLKAVRRLWRTNREDGFVAVAAFILTLAFAPHLDWGILLGALLALVLYLHRTMEPTVVALARHPDGTLRDADAFGLPHCEHILMLRFDGRLYFANTSYFEETMLERLTAQPQLKVLIVVASGINSTDASGEEVLDHLVAQLEESGIKVLLCGVKWRVMAVLERSGFVAKYGAERFVRTETQALERAWELIGCDHRQRCPLLAPPSQPVLAPAQNGQI